MKTRASTKTVTRNRTVTSRYTTPLPVLVKATLGQVKSGNYDGLANFDQKKPLTPVKVFGAEYLREGSELNKAVRKSMLGRNWNLFLAANQLRDAHEKGDSYEIDAANQKLFAALLPKNPAQEHAAMVSRIAQFWLHPTWSSRTAPVNLPPAMAHEMEAAWLVLWWNSRRKQFLPAIFCPDYKTAMYVRAVLRDLRACPGCDTPFIPDRLDQQYCSTRCSDRHRTRKCRHLAKLRAKAH